MIWDYRHFEVHGGKEVIIDELATALVERGHEVCLVTKSTASHRYCELQDHLALTRYELPESINEVSANFIIEVTRFKRFVKTFRPDVIHLNTFSCPSRRLVDIAYSSTNSSFGVLLSLHDLPELLSLIRVDPDAIAIRMISAVVVPSNYCRERLARSKLKISVRLIPHGIQLFSRTTSDSKVKFLYSGRLVIEKGLTDLLRAWAQIEGNLPKTTLEILGDGPIRELLESQSRALGIEHRVTWYGHIPHSQVSNFLNKDQILIQPTLIPEAFGLAVLESMSVGSACIVSDTGALPELIRDEVDGLVFSARNIESLASAMLRLARDERLRIQLGKSAQKRVQGEFSSQTFISRYESLYAELSKS